MYEGLFGRVVNLYLYGFYIYILKTKLKRYIIFILFFHYSSLVCFTFFYRNFLIFKIFVIPCIDKRRYDLK